MLLYFPPVFFALAAGIWILISTLNHPSTQKNEAGLSEVDQGKKSNYFIQIAQGARGFAESVWVGAKLVLLNRRFICKSTIPLNQASKHRC